MGKAFEEYKVGDKFQLGKTITETDVVIFARHHRDFSIPSLYHEEYAKKSFFKGRIEHGLLVEAIMALQGAQYFQGAYLGHTMSLKRLPASAIRSRQTSKS
jgi:3-hydroxybutyryl-CoA dehydratase